MGKYGETGVINVPLLLASAFVGVVAMFGFLIIPSMTEPLADLYLEPQHKTVPTDETFQVHIMVRSSIPTNVFAGELKFNPEILRVVAIDYNISIADLWAELPWYSNGDGTLNFVGGTTRKGGFLGTDVLISVTFKALREGSGSLVITDAHVLGHDGYGTEINLPQPIDAIFTIESPDLPLEDVLAKSNRESTVSVVRVPPSTDLNGDGKQSILDVSIFMINIGGNDGRYDFNLDGSVNMKDLSILMGAG